MRENQKLIAHKGRLKEWLFRDCLPIWWSYGADLQIGGFYERLNQDVSPDNIERRTRVAARQIYSYSKAKLMGYLGECDGPITQGLEWLDTKCLNVDGYYSAVLDAKGDAIDANFNLYDHAFILTGLAAANQLRPHDLHLREQAEELRDRILADFAHPIIGFEEANPRRLPLKANPHMHMLEASLAWVAAGGDAKWLDIANSIVHLATSKFIDTSSGAILEYFDGDWNPIADKQIQQVEPGHQFEWAWLLLKWAKISHDNSILPVAKKLVQIGETYGVDPLRGVTFNSLNMDLTPRDFSARLWPQTERIKAHIELARHFDDDAEIGAAQTSAIKACDGLGQYLNTDMKGLYADRMNEDGTIINESAPASTLYHLVCAIDELNRK
ncbi:MAG: mannose-6-phosphate isomerase [Hyphomonadaceae bacterium]|nr:MAG: mannose-6-phosphate isomerase [Hyphomonadaceae bacterium]